MSIKQDSAPSTQDGDSDEREESNTTLSMETPGDGSFPAGLLEWAGHRTGGVRRLFSGNEGRPSGKLIETSLLERLRKWAVDIAGGVAATPRILLLVGGPGNGKTEAVEEAVRELERSMALDGEISKALHPLFNPADGRTVPRAVALNLGELGFSHQLHLSIVQDASVGDTEGGGRTPPECLISDLEAATALRANHIYLACVNRGILDDSLILAGHNGSRVQSLISSIVGALANKLAAPSCWPLAGHREIAIWPMDVESLFLDATGQSPAAQALDVALDATRWAPFGTCAAGERCPYCWSRRQLASAARREAFLRILRQYELASGKRWNFRDLFSLFSFVLAGTPSEGSDDDEAVCSWAAHLLATQLRTSARTMRLRNATPFLLVAAEYPHALFGVWPRLKRNGIRSELRDLGLSEDSTLQGFSSFLSGGQSASVPRTLRAELSSLALTLDPANVNPDLRVRATSRTELELRDIDARFSHSVREGFEFLSKYKFLSPNETVLLKLLAAADERLADPAVRNKKPSVAAEIQIMLRGFAGRLVRRTLGVRAALVQDSESLTMYSQLVAGNESLAVETARRVENLLNVDGRFVVTLNNTFGEPQPPALRRVVLETSKQKVRTNLPDTKGRPLSDLRFLTVGTRTSTQALPLTYELFRAVRELQEGMLAASLPRPVVASLDTARARLAGLVVRDADALDGAEIQLGIRGESILVEDGHFQIRAEGAP